MSSDDIKVEGFAASDIISQLATAIGALPEKEKKAQIQKSNAIFELLIKNSEGKEASWIIDLKKDGTVTKGPLAVGKPNVTLIMDDDIFVELAAGKIGGQKAYMTGKLKTKGNMMLATKLEGILKLASMKQKAKL